MPKKNRGQEFSDRKDVENDRACKAQKQSLRGTTGRRSAVGICGRGQPLCDGNGDFCRLSARCQYDYLRLALVVRFQNFRLADVPISSGGIYFFARALDNNAEALCACKPVLDPNSFHSQCFGRNNIVVQPITDHHAFFGATSCKFKRFFKNLFVRFGVSDFCGCSNHLKETLKSVYNLLKWTVVFQKTSMPRIRKILEKCTEKTVCLTSKRQVEGIVTDKNEI